MGLFDGIPYGMNPYGNNPTILQRPIVPNPPQINLGQPRELEKVNGIESVKQYPMQPNSMVALFDMNDDIFYVKITDASNYPTIRKFRFHEELDAPAPARVEEPKYVTIEEFEKFKEEVLNGQQSIRVSTAPAVVKSEQPAKSKKHDASVGRG